MTAKCLADFKDKYVLPNQVELVPANNDEVYDRPGYCALYAYPFTIGYSFPLPPLVEEFYRFYRVCPAQLAPFVYKVIKMLSKFAELAGVEITVRYLVHLFTPSFYRGRC